LFEKSQHILYQWFEIFALSYQRARSASSSLLS
jgi:hypothetical protein